MSLRSLILRFLAACLVVGGFFQMTLITQAQSTGAVVILPPLGTLDPLSVSSSDQTGRDVIENLFVGLTRYDPLKNTVIPALAESWEFTPDYRQWTFKLREDARWVRVESGAVVEARPVVAGDFLYGLRRACDPNPPNPVTGTIFVIAGCRKVATTNPLQLNDIFIAQTLGLRVINATTLQITLAYPIPYLPNLLALPEFRPLARESFAATAPEGTDWVQPSSALTNGPFALAGRDANGLTLLRNPFWNDESAGNLEQITVNFGAADAVQAAIAAGTVDFARIDSTLAASLPADRVLRAAGLSVTVLGFSADTPAGANENLRRALGLSVDRAAIAALFGGAATPAVRFTSPAAIDAAPLDPISFDVAAAQTAMAAVNARCAFPEPFEVWIDESPAAEAVAQALREQWQQNLGCNPRQFRIVKQPLAVVRRLADGTYSTVERNAPLRPPMWLYTFTPDHRDVTAWLADGVHCRFGFLKAYTPCTDADGQLDAAVMLPDATARAQYITAAEALLFGQAGIYPVIPLYHNVVFAYQSAALQNASANGVWFAGWQK